MIYNYIIDYYKCPKCEEKTHCEKCGEEIAEHVKDMTGIINVSIDPHGRTACVEAGEGYDEDAFLDALDELGVMA